MVNSKQVYLSYWRQLKLFIDEQGLDWVFSSFEGESGAVVRIGAPKYKICLELTGTEVKDPKNLISAGFWIPDSHADFEKLRARRLEVEAAVGKRLIWDSRTGRKSCWIRVAVVMDLAQEKNWPASFAWFAGNAGKIRDVCHQFLK